MRVYRITISSWTSSFRYPNIISGFQPTLLVPPISTVLGILNACAGKYINHHQLTLGYYFDFEAKSVDLETIYQIETDDRNVPKNLVKSNIMRREFLFNNRLFVYFNDSKWADLFKTPYYPILLGRGSDLATIDKIEAIELPKIANASKVKGQIIPVIGNYLPGTIQALPNYFTDTIPRNNIGTEAYSIIPYDAPDIPTRLTAYRDIIDDTEIDIYFHQLDLEQKE